MGVSYYKKYIYRKKRRFGLHVIYLALTRNNHIKDAQDFLYDFQTLKATVVNNKIHFTFFYTAEISPEMKLQSDTMKCLSETNGTYLES